MNLEKHMALAVEVKDLGTGTVLQTVEGGRSCRDRPDRGSREFRNRSFPILSRRDVETRSHRSTWSFGEADKED